MSAGPLLEVRDLSKRFGGVRALDGVSFRADTGEILGVIGDGLVDAFCIRVTENGF